MPDPKLKEAMKEVKAILVKYDLGGLVFLSSQTHSEYLYKIDPTWSCAKGDNNEVRVKALREDYPSKEAHGKAVSETIGLIAGLQESCTKGAENMLAVLVMIGDKISFSHISRKENDEN